jgi:hypothetical protein
MGRLSREEILALAKLTRDFRAQCGAQPLSVGIGLEDSKPILRVVVRTQRELAMLPSIFGKIPIRARVGTPGVLAVASAV